MSYAARPATERFWEKVDKSGSCWLWTGATASGYGNFFLRKINRRTVTIGAHVFSFELANGPTREGLQVLHQCDVKLCVRPDHLFAGTQKDNVLDMHNKGRWRYAPRDQTGERNPSSIISDAQVAEMLRELSDGGRPTYVARKYGIQYATLWAIRRRKTLSY